MRKQLQLAGKKIKWAAIALVLILLSSSGASAQILTFEFASLAGNEVTAPSNSNDPNLSASSISRGAGLTASTNGGRFNATNWATTSIANAVSGDDYMEFTITPNGGFQFSVSSITINFQRSGTGNTQIELRSSVDGYTSALGTNFNIVDNTSTQTHTFTFTQAASTSPVTYRFYSYAEATGGSGGIGDGTGNDLIVNGSVTSTGGPSLSWTPSALSGFSTNQGTPSVSQSADLSGSSLSPAAGNIVVAAPAGFQVSLDNTSFSASVNVPYTGGALAATPIYTRISAAAAAGVVSGNATATLGATTANLALSGVVFAVGPFNPGDIMFTAFNTDAPDGFAFVNWVSIPAGQTLFFTDNAWDGSALLTNENTLEWNNNTGSAIAPGTVIYCFDNSGTASVDLGTVVTGNLSGLSASNDNVFIYTGTAAAPEFIFGIHNAAWLTSGGVSTTSSYLPAVLNFATGNIVTTSALDNWEYSNPRNDQAAIADYKAIVANPANWTGNDAFFAISSLDFTVAGGPSVTPSTTTLALCGTSGSNGVAGTFTLTGDFLTGNLSVSAPANVQVSVDGITYANSVVIPVSGGNIVGEPFTVYARTTGAYAVGPIAGNISVSGGGITAFDIALSGTVGTAANLSSGDITILGANGTGTDRFSFVTWVSIPNNTVITFTDNAYASASGPLNTNENTLVWQNNTGSAIAAGTVIVFECAANPATVDLGTVVSGSLDGLANGADNIFAYQGPVCNPTFLHGIITGGNWITTGTVTNGNSYLPASLNNANGNIALTTGGNGEYSGSRSSQTVLNNYRALVNNTANWTIQGTEIAVLSSADFSTSGPGVNLSVSSNTATEAAATVINVTVTAEAAVIGDKTVTLSIGGTGITAGDYTIGTTSLVITNGNTTASTTFTIVDDVLPEGLETATISITSVTAGAVIGVTSSQDIAITDNDNANIVINEIMYNNPGGDEEWIELYNGSPVAITLNSGWSIANSNPAWTYNFTSPVTIPVGGYITLQVGSSGAFPFTPTVVFSSTANQLVNSTSTITLREGVTIIDQVTYADASPWPTEADGNGPSVALNGVALDNSIGSNWGACKIGGTPGAANPNCNSNIYYTITSGDVDGEIWSTIPNGTTPILATFSSSTDLVIQTNTIVQWDASAIPANNVTVNPFGRIRRNSSNSSDMAYLSLYGTLTNYGIIGNGNVFDAFGINIEGVNTIITGNGVFNFGRIRKTASDNTTSSVIIDSNINLRFPGTALYNNQPSTTFNLTLNAGKTINVIGDGLTAGDVSVDGTNGFGAGERAGTYTINGNLNITGTFYALTDNVSLVPGLTVGSTGRISVNTLDMRFDGLADVGFNAVVNTGGRITVTNKMLQREGTFNSNGGLVFNAGASLLHGAGTPGLAPDPGGLVTGNIIFNVNANSGYGKYNFWSTPVTGANILSITQSGLQYGSDNNTYEYNPVNSTGTDVEGLRDGWVAKTNADIMTNGRGYITNSSPEARFTGTANNGNVNLSLTGNGFTRFNLAGNPYPSSLDASAFLAANGPSGTNQIVPAIYFWDDDGSIGAAYDAGDYVATNPLGTSATGGNGSGTFNGAIAAGQGFFLEATPTGTSVQFTNAMRNSSTAFFFETEELSRVWLKVSNTENVKNETMLAFLDEATDGYDASFDAKKFPGNEGLALYTTIGENAYAIQAWEKQSIDRIIPVGLNASIPATHTFSLSKIDNLDPTIMVYLEDRELGIFTNLRVSDYSFNVSDEVSGTGRFFLHMSAPAEISATAETCSGADGSIRFEAPESWNYSITNADNMIVAEGNAFNQPEVNSLSAGDYLITMTADGYTTTLVETIGASTPVAVQIDGVNEVEANTSAQFAALVNGAETISWDFGDGSEVVTGTVVNHTYTTPGIYTVTAFVSNDNCSAQQSMEIRVDADVTGIASVNNAAFSMFPNPANERVTIVTEDNAVVEIADITGKIVYTFIANQQVNMIETAGLQEGVYMVSLIGENGRTARRLVITH